MKWTGFPMKTALTMSLALLSACTLKQAPVNITAIPQSDTGGTAVASTVSAFLVQQTLSAEPEAVTHATMETTYPTIGFVQTNTQAVETPTPSPEPQKTSTKSPAPIPTSTEALCDHAEVILDVTIPENSILYREENFIKTWRIRNTGTCTWTPEYALVFFDGERLRGQEIVYLPAIVQAGEIVDLSVELQAPIEEGLYYSFWQMRNADGILFNPGLEDDQLFQISINVQAQRPTMDPDLPTDFYHNYCAARWFSSTGILICPSPNTDDNSGSVTRTLLPINESGSLDDEPAIILVPDSDRSGFIRGEFPPVEIHDKDHFQALVGCAGNSYGCNATVRLDYRAEGGTIRTMKEWNEVLDGEHMRVDEDLSQYAGDFIEFILVVKNDGSTTRNHIFWMVPGIVNVE